MASPKALLIKGPLNDLSDILYIARKEGKIVLKAKKVKVNPLVVAHGSDYVVVVEPDGSGCSKASDVGSRKTKEK